MTVGTQRENQKNSRRKWNNFGLSLCFSEEELQIWSKQRKKETHKDRERNGTIIITAATNFLIFLIFFIIEKVFSVIFRRVANGAFAKEWDFCSESKN